MDERTVRKTVRVTCSGHFFLSFFNSCFSSWLPETVFPGLAGDMPLAQQPSESMIIRSQVVSVAYLCQDSEILSLCDPSRVRVIVTP